MKITVETLVKAPMANVWHAYTTPDDIKQWNAASDDWHTTQARVDLREGGAFSSRMEAKDGSFGFDFAGTYTKIVPHALIEYAFGDRVATVAFAEVPGGVKVEVSFDAESEHSEEQQRQGWQAILNNFAKHVEARVCDERIFHTERTLPFSPQLVYNAFASAELLATWWGPEGFTNEFQVFEFNVGGRWQFVMVGPDGARYQNQNIFTELESASRVVIRHDCEPFFTLTVQLTQVADGTHLSWHQVLDNVEMARAVRQRVGPANEQNLDRLTRVLERSS
jgi:uncharacterized protein YndB with AHSA1/START domain